jgi:hypothetical protein
MLLLKSVTAHLSVSRILYAAIATRALLLRANDMPNGRRTFFLAIKILTLVT